ncbi:MAG: SMC-Scp complex subunit ScpB [Bdellovibrionales bacterium]|nr:SMC-Scp complex subunit ScpB [Bdellovibrionales bacterium]
MKLSDKNILSILESALFFRSEPIRLAELENLFGGELTQKQIKNFMDELSAQYQQEERGIFVEEISNGYQLRTKPANKNWLLKLTKQRAFRLSHPSIEVLSIVAYRQPCSRQDIEDIRGVECGHLLRTLMEKGLVSFAGKSSSPGKPFLYKTTNRFLEIFGFKTLKDLPSEEEIREHLPEVPEETSETLQEAAKELTVDGKVLIPYEADEKENESLKTLLKDIPSNINFLDTEDNSKN